jgi:KDO2-lipid IV(A) lauroyltransferase
MRFFVQMTDSLVAFLLHYVVRYRLGVITDNLKNSFAYPSGKALNEDIHSNYLYLARILRQIIVKPTSQLLSRRMRMGPCNSLDQWLAEGKSVIVTFGHTGNWEWTGSYLGMQYPDQVCALYKKIKSPLINSLMHRRRLSHVNYLVETRQMGELLRLIKKKPVLILMIADQNPGSAQGMIWADFLGRNTAFVNGPETLALKYGLPVVYISSLSASDGSYDLSCETIYDGKEVVSPGLIMQKFAEHLERNIQAHRSHWLWSHRRWKRSAPAVGLPSGN